MLSVPPLALVWAVFGVFIMRPVARGSVNKSRSVRQFRKHSQLGLNRAGVESKFYSEGALGELNPTLKTVLDILKGISSVRGR